MKQWGRKKPRVYVSDYGLKLLIWGGLSCRAIIPIKVAEGNIDSEACQFILLSCFVESMKAFYPDRFSLQQDDARPHVSK